MRRATRILAALTTAALPVLATPGLARAYHIDCAILLCLAGGFPPHPTCVEAKAVMIARITPWPIEPPVQPWNCPMAASATTSAPPRASVHKATAVKTLPIEAEFADPAFDYVRTVKLWHVRYSRSWDSDGGFCDLSDATQVGTYDTGLAFSWSKAPRTAVPPYVVAAAPPDCSKHRLVGIGIEYRDYEGNQSATFIPY